MRFLGINWGKTKRSAENTDFIIELEKFNNKHIDEMSKIGKLVTGLEQHVKKVSLSNSDVRVLSDCINIVEKATNYYEKAKTLMNQDSRFINASRKDDYKLIRNLLSDIAGPGIIINGRNINIALANVVASAKNNAPALNSYMTLTKEISSYTEKLNGLKFNLNKIIKGSAATA